MQNEREALWTAHAKLELCPLPKDSQPIPLDEIKSDILLPMGCRAPNGMRFRFSQETLDRSKKIYCILLDQLAVPGDKCLTYKEVGAMLGCHHRALRMPLAKIQDECNDRNWPTLTTLVVKKDSGIPGAGCDAGTPSAFVQLREEIKAVSWPKQPWW